MSRRKLKAVEYDQDYVNLDDDTEIRRLIATLEELHLKRRDENWSSRLLDEHDPVKWTLEMEQYFSEFGAPAGCSRAAAVDYVLSAAVCRIYEKKGEDLSLAHLRERAELMLAANRDSQNPLNRLDYTSPQFAENARALCSILGLSDQHSDPKVLMKAACLYIIENLADDVISAEADEQEMKKKINETLVEVQNLTMDMSKKPNMQQVQYGR
uniref:Uncharacterized protein n=1 Tax=Caenorhabditis japonica TaxID=281687 RepID=A0A8R1HKA1_CAEJA